MLVLFQVYVTFVIRRYSEVTVNPAGTSYVSEVAPAIVVQDGEAILVFDSQTYEIVEEGIVVVPAAVDAKAAGFPPAQMV